MKVKRTARLTVVLAAIVAMVGIAAVSYAAWQGGTTAEAQGATANIELIGFNEETAALNFNLGDKKIVPYDQTAGYTEATMVKVISTEIPAFQTTGAYKIKVEALDKTTGNATTLDFWYQIGTTAVTTAPANTTGWTLIGSENSDYTPATQPKVTTAVSDLKLSIILDSSDYEDMNKEITFRVTLELA